MALSQTFHSLRLRNFFSRTFVPRYQTLQAAVNQTPLVILLWSPHSEVWARAIDPIYVELERLGHTVFYRAELGVPTSMRSKKGVEYKATDTIDLIVATQPAYEPIGDVRDYVEFLVVDTKMVLFISDTAPDRQAYAQAVNEIKNRYNNIETITLDHDLTQGGLREKILAKLNLFQMVKQRAIKRADAWGLAVPSDVRQSAAPATLRPFPYNLIELYRMHRNEIDPLLDSTTLFVLAYVGYMQKITARVLWRDISLEETQMQARMALLVQSRLIADTLGEITATDLGKQLLKELGILT